jgi:DNA-directed RNA polymerase subunit RPC12/RpoP
VIFFSHEKVQKAVLCFFCRLINGHLTSRVYGEVMNEKKDTTFLIQCIWCGAKIRDDEEEEAKGVCLQCFYQILSNHLQAQKRSAYGEFVIDR